MFSSSVNPNDKSFLKRGFRHVITALLLIVVSGWLNYAQGEDLTFAVVSDHRSSLQGLGSALKFIDTKHVDFIMIVGDFSPIERAYANYYSKHGFIVGADNPPDRQRAYFVLGNHDSPPNGSAFFQNNIAPYYPKNGPDDEPLGTIFSFDWGDCHFTITNQYWKFPAGGYTQEQLDWIKQDLSATNKTYKFVIGHEPAFPRRRHVGDSLDIDISMRDRFWQLLAEEGALAFFCGHIHFMGAIFHDGVYQLNSGIAESNQVDVMIVQVNSFTATAHYYETHGSTPTESDEIETIDLLSDSGYRMYGISTDCVSKQVKAAGDMGKALISCRIKGIGKPTTYDFDDCIAKVKNKFEFLWENEAIKADEQGLNCSDCLKDDVENLIQEQVEAIYNKISEGIVLDIKRANKLVRDLLKAAGAKYSSIVYAESKNIKSPDPQKLDTAYSKADEKFEKKWKKAIDRAKKKGLQGEPSYDDVNDILNDLIETTRCY